MAGLFDEFKGRLSEYRAMMFCVEQNANTLADLLLQAGLRKLSGRQLERMKRELRDFNIQTHRWSDE